MKRYLVFAGMFYYPSGGGNDYVAGFDTIEDAKNAYAVDSDWCHIFDTETERIVAELSHVAREPYVAGQHPQHYAVWRDK